MIMLLIEEIIPKYIWLYAPSTWASLPQSGYWCVCNLEITFESDGTVIAEYVSYDGGSPKRIISATSATIEEALLKLNDRIERYEDEEVRGFNAHRDVNHPLFDKYYRPIYRWSVAEEDYTTPWHP